MKFWAIRRKTDGFYMPATHRANTHAEPQNPAIHPPRLFTKKRSAHDALRWWLAGRTHVKRTGGYSYYGDDDISEDWVTEKVEERKADDMEVVELNIERVQMTPTYFAL